VDSKRYEPTILDGYDDEIQDEPCKFKPWFEKVLEEHGLSFGGYYDNVHFYISSDDVWNKWVYGPKLYAHTIRDPELLKLRNLFNKLYEYWSDEENWYRENMTRNGSFF
jgi:hypothetical protein